MPKKMYNPDKIFDFIVRWKRNHDGNSPSLSQIMTNCHVSSKSVVIFLLEKLETQKKIIRIGPKYERRIHVVGGHWDFT